MFTETMFADAAIAIFEARNDNGGIIWGGNVWENINSIFKARSWDKRYKVYFSACTNNGSGFWCIGDKNPRKFIVEFMDGNIYVRPCSDYDKYTKRACYEVVPQNGFYKIKWQYKTLI